MKKILIIGAGFLQSFVIKKAKDMGYYTIAIDKNPNSVGFKYADEYSVIDIIDQQACLEYAKSKNIDGVVTAATDYGVISTAYIAEQLNLPGLNYEVAKLIKNKYLVRKTLFENNIDDVSQYYELDNINELGNIISKIKFPVMVKPCDGSGSKGAIRVDSLTELRLAYEAAKKASLVGKVLIEDFVEGNEYGVESFVYNGEIYVLGVMGKIMTSPPKYAELGHFFPSELDIEDKVITVVKNAIKALGINFGSVNMDVLVTKDKKVCIVDVGARMGGNLIGSHIIPSGTGIDYMANILRASVGDTVELKVERKLANVATRLLALRKGKVVELPDFNEIKERFNVEIFHHLKIGTEIKEYKNNLDGCGYVISVSDDLNIAKKCAKEAKILIDQKIKRHE